MRRFQRTSASRTDVTTTVRNSRTSQRAAQYARQRAGIRALLLEVCRSVPPSSPSRPPAPSDLSQTFCFFDASVSPFSGVSFSGVSRPIFGGGMPGTGHSATPIVGRVIFSICACAVAGDLTHVL